MSSRGEMKISLKLMIYQGNQNTKVVECLQLGGHKRSHAVSASTVSAHGMFSSTKQEC